MLLCLPRTAEGPSINLKLLGCSACLAAALFVSTLWLLHFCPRQPHLFQVRVLQLSCETSTNRTSFLASQGQDYQCYGPAGSTEAVIVTISEGLQPHVLEAVRNNRAAYVEQHAYRYCEFDRRLDPTRGASWNKIVAMLLVMQCSEYVLALDSDAMIVNYGMRIREIWEEHGGNKDILFSKDYGGPSVVNAGSVLVRRTGWSMLFLQHLYNQHVVREQHGSFGQEQGGINWYAQDNPKTFTRHAGIVASSVFNQHRLRYEPGTFVAHYAGWEPSAEKYDHIAADLAHNEGLWAKYTQDNHSRLTDSFCTNAMTIIAPQWKLNDRVTGRLSRSTGFLSRLYVPTSRVAGLPSWPLLSRSDAHKHNDSSAGHHRSFKDGLCHNRNLTVLF